MIASLRGLAVAGIALLGLVGGAQAAPVVADFTGPVASFGGSLVVDIGGGLEVLVSPRTHNGGPDADAPFPGGGVVIAAELSRNDEGVGIFTGVGDSDDLDGFGVAERLLFTFNQPVTLFSVVFENIQGDSEVEGPDQFDMAVDDMDVDVDALLGTDDINEYAGAAFGNDSYLAEFADGLTGTVFQFYTTDFNDRYRIRQFLVEAVGDGGGADVPTPPALLLLGMGLAGLGFARRYRR